jgi:SAM-dependent methyltransferase
MASEFLCHSNNLNILDIGSGVGKFCLVGATLNPRCHFFGVDIRKKFVDISNELRIRFAVQNISFVCNDIAQLNMLEYDGIYFFNSFQERIDNTARIDENSKISKIEFVKYMQYLFKQFNQMAVGTRLATYHTANFFIPDNFRLVGEELNGMLKFYVKFQNANDDLSLDLSRTEKHILINGDN